MKFRDLRQYVSGNLEKWASHELAVWVKDTIVGLRRLSFGDNFESFEYYGDISASTEITITNRLDSIPTRYLILDVSGGCNVSRGPTAWTSDFVTIKNYTASATKARIVFMR